MQYCGLLTVDPESCKAEKINSHQNVLYILDKKKKKKKSIKIQNSNIIQFLFPKCSKGELVIVDIFFCNFIEIRP